MDFGQLEASFFKDLSYLKPELEKAGKIIKKNDRFMNTSGVYFAFAIVDDKTILIEQCGSGFGFDVVNKKLPLNKFIFKHDDNISIIDDDILKNKNLLELFDDIQYDINQKDVIDKDYLLSEQERLKKEKEEEIGKRKQEQNKETETKKRLWEKQGKCDLGYNASINKNVIKQGTDISLTCSKDFNKILSFDDFQGDFFPLIVKIPLLIINRHPDENCELETPDGKKIAIKDGSLHLNGIKIRKDKLSFLHNNYEVVKGNIPLYNRCPKIMVDVLEQNTIAFYCWDKDVEIDVKISLMDKDTLSIKIGDFYGKYDWKGVKDLMCCGLSLYRKISIGKFLEVTKWDKQEFLNLLKKHYMINQL